MYTYIHTYIDTHIYIYPFKYTWLYTYVCKCIKSKSICDEEQLTGDWVSDITQRVHKDVRRAEREPSPVRGTGLRTTGGTTAQAGGEGSLGPEWCEMEGGATSKANEFPTTIHKDC